MAAEDRKIRTVRTIGFPIEMVWKVWTEPEHLIHWWGPKGFTSLIHVMELKEGGEWRLTLRGPDGTEFPNRSIFKEIDPLRTMIIEHFNPHFLTTVVFASGHGATTVDWTLLFDTAEMRETVAKAHNAEEGQRQNLDRLESYLSELHHHT